MSPLDGPPWLEGTGVLEVAHDYGIPFVRDLSEDSSDTLDSERSPAPNGGYAILCTGAIAWKGIWQPKSPPDPLDAAYAFHEMMHVLCTPPSLLTRDGLDDLWEGWVLLPFERTLARRKLTRPVYDEVIDYQRGTYVTDFIELSEWASVTRSAWWRRGLDTARLLGLLDPAGRPTGRRPDWSKIDVDHLLDASQAAVDRVRYPRKAQTQAARWRR